MKMSNFKPGIYLIYSGGQVPGQPPRTVLATVDYSPTSITKVQARILDPKTMTPRYKHTRNITPNQLAWKFHKSFCDGHVSGNRETRIRAIRHAKQQIKRIFEKETAK